jgi:HSP20 family protein
MSLIPRSNFLDMDKFFDDFYAPLKREGGSLGSFFTPRVDIRENGDHYEITAELPGVKKEDLHLHLEDGVLTINAETKQEDKEEKEGKVIRQERRYGKYSRSFSLGDSVHQEDIQAEFDNGVLKITAPKVSQTAPVRRMIDIK